MKKEIVRMEKQSLNAYIEIRAVQLTKEEHKQIRNELKELKHEYDVELQYIDSDSIEATIITDEADVEDALEKLEKHGWEW